MTTFKNSAKYGELIFSYLDLAIKDDSPISVREVLSRFEWRFKGGSLREAAEGGVLEVETSGTVYPDGLSKDLAEAWPNGAGCVALRGILARRSRKFRRRARQATAGTWMMITDPFNLDMEEGPIRIRTGMSAVYHAFGEIWKEALTGPVTEEWDQTMAFSRELLLGSVVACHMHVGTTQKVFERYRDLLAKTKVSHLQKVVFELKHVMAAMGGRQVQKLARRAGRALGEEMEEKGLTKNIWDESYDLEFMPSREELGPLGTHKKVGHKVVMVGQGVVLWSKGRLRHALSMGDVERLHQAIMACTSCLVGCVAQAVIGTPLQQKLAKKAVEVAANNISRLVKSAKEVPIGDEVLVCKGYRRAYTASLGRLAGGMCKEETKALLKEAEETAPPGVLDIQGYFEELQQLDAASCLNAGKVFKLCPAPDVSPGLAMMDRIRQIKDPNTFDPEMTGMFTDELRSQVLRAYIRSGIKRLPLRDPEMEPVWYQDYREGNYDMVPSSELDHYLAWEGTAKMPEVSPYDPTNWKDSSLGADEWRQVESSSDLGVKRNMLTRLLYDDECPMPGTKRLNDEHIIKFFTKPEGHKDPARGIFSSNLRDRQAGSWTEKAVEKVARHHPSFMIGAGQDVKELRVQQLVSLPVEYDWIPLYYSFDISGWSAKMPGEPQRISHDIWGKLYGGHLFDKARQFNEGARIYQDHEGYFGWYVNTNSNLEGFNGKEMTMVLVALLSLSVRVWRREVVEAGVLPGELAEKTTALLFAYIDDGLSRIDLPREYAKEAFGLYKKCVVDTFRRCGFAVETSKCFPSTRFAIFLNEVYLSGRHVVHGVRAAMGIGAEPTERHTSLVERVSSVSAGVRGAIMAGLGGVSGSLLMGYHLWYHMAEWTTERDPVLLALWCMMPRAWGGLGMPNLHQLTVSGSGSAFEEGVATLQKWAQINKTVKYVYLQLCRTQMTPRSSTSIMTAPLSSRCLEGYMVDSRLAGMVRDSLQRDMEEGKLSTYANRLMRYADVKGFRAYAAAVVPEGVGECVQEQMLDNAYEAHPHSVFSSFAKRVEKSETVSRILGARDFRRLQELNRTEAEASIRVVRARLAR